MWAIQHAPPSAVDSASLGAALLLSAALLGLYVGLARLLESGPEASIITTFVTLAIALVLLVLALRRHNWLPLQRRAGALNGLSG
jgi:hypothetical protein